MTLVARSPSALAPKLSSAKLATLVRNPTARDRLISPSTCAKSAVRNGTASQPGHTLKATSRATLTSAPMA